MMDINPASHLGDFLGTVLRSPKIIWLRKGRGLHYSHVCKTSKSTTSALTCLNFCGRSGHPAFGPPASEFVKSLEQLVFTGPTPYSLQRNTQPLCKENT